MLLCARGLRTCGLLGSALFFFFEVPGSGRNPLFASFTPGFWLLILVFYSLFSDSAETA